MSDEFLPDIEIREDQAEAIARGLYAVAKADGNVHEREAAMITEFFNATTDHASHLAAALPSKDLRQLFIKTAVLLAHVDGTYAPNEAKQIAEYAKACGIDAKQLSGLEASVKDYLLGHLSHLHNVHGVAAVAKELKR